MVITVVGLTMTMIATVATEEETVRVESILTVGTEVEAEVG